MNYENEYHSLPPAYVADANGKPMHSWRVLILPYLEARDVYDEYNFKEPWNGANNLKLSNKLPSRIFRCPAEDGSPTSTSYVAVVGAETAWPGTKTVRHQDIRDGTSNTIVLVEVTNSGINWLEPRDLTLEQALQGINDSRAALRISSHHGSGANVGWGDAHVLFLGNDTPIEKLRAFLTISGSEALDVPE